MSKSDTPQDIVDGCFKLCGKCKSLLHLDSFNYSAVTHSHRQAWCRQCNQDYNRRHKPTVARWEKEQEFKRQLLDLNG